MTLGWNNRKDDITSIRRGKMDKQEKASKPQKIVSIPDDTFERDWRKSNPALHLLYVEWAVKHLALVKECVFKLTDQSNLNTDDFAVELLKEIDRKVKTDAAWAKAKEILDSIEQYRWTRPEEEE